MASVIDAPEYQKARSYFLNLYRSHITSARKWRGYSKKQVAWSLELAADCREKLINGARLHRERQVA